MKEVGKKFFFILKVLLTFVLVYLVMDKISFRDFENSIKTIRAGFVVALFYALVFTLIKALKWYYLVRQTSEKGTTWGDAVKSYFVGMVGGLLTPGRVGEIARTVYLEKHNKSLIIYLVAVDKVFDITVVVLLALPGIYYFTGVFAFFATAGVGIILAGLLVGIFFPHYPPRWLNRLLERTGKWAGIRERLSLIEREMESMTMKFKLKFLGITFLSYGIVIIEFYWLVNNYQNCPLAAICLTQPLIMLINIVPVTIAGLGIREGAAVVLLASFGVGGAAAISSAFMLFLLNTAFPALAGALFLTHRQKQKFCSNQKF